MHSQLLPRGKKTRDILVISLICVEKWCFHIRCNGCASCFLLCVLKGRECCWLCFCVTYSAADKFVLLVRLGGGGGWEGSEGDCVALQ